MLFEPNQKHLGFHPKQPPGMLSELSESSIISWSMQHKTPARYYLWLRSAHFKIGHATAKAGAGREKVSSLIFTTASPRAAKRARWRKSLSASWHRLVSRSAVALVASCKLHFCRKAANKGAKMANKRPTDRPAGRNSYEREKESDLAHSPSRPAWYSKWLIVGLVYFRWFIIPWTKTSHNLDCKRSLQNSCLRLANPEALILFSRQLQWGFQRENTIFIYH